MTSPRVEAIDGALQVSGDLTFATVTELLNASQRLLVGGKDGLVIDLAGVGRADSAGLALLIEWLRTARAVGRELHFRAVPAQMQAIAAASGLTDVLPLAS